MLLGRLVYLDQNYWDRLDEDLIARLAVASRAGELLLPVSNMHWLEIMKANPEVRRRLVQKVDRLSRGRYLMNPIDVMRLEFERYRGRYEIDWLRLRLITTDPIRMMGPSGPLWLRPASWFFRRLVKPEAFLAVMANIAGSAESTRSVNEILSRGAAAASSATATGTHYDRSDLARAIGVPHTALPESDADLLSVFPSVAVREKLQSVIVSTIPGGLERNDLVDVAFLASTLPYFDVVTVDRRMGARVREANLGSLLRARVVSRIEDLAAAIGA